MTDGIILSDGVLIKGYSRKAEPTWRRLGFRFHVESAVLPASRLGRCALCAPLASIEGVLPPCHTAARALGQKMPGTSDVGRSERSPVLLGSGKVQASRARNELPFPKRNDAFPAGR